MIRTPHLKLIARHSVRHGIRGGSGLVAMFFTLTLGLILANVVIKPLELGDKVANQAELTDKQHAEYEALKRHNVVSLGSKAIDWAVDPAPDELDYLAETQPVAVSAILVLLFLVTPLLSCLGGFNQTSGDIASKGLRFLLVRTERPNIFLGRFIGTYLFSAAIYGILFAILALYMALKVNVHPPGEMVAWLAQGYVRLLIFSLPYIALCAWISANIDSAFGSLVVCLLVAYMFPLLVGIAGSINANAHYLQYLTPWGYKYWLLCPLGAKFFGGVAIMLGFTGVFVTVGLKNFTTRDL
jgi:ABC-type transport system involved in multi-copper enzyme maturation permease subunit